jgi:hypothetical protein
MPPVALDRADSEQQDRRVRQHDQEKKVDGVAHIHAPGEAAASALLTRCS